MPYQLVLQFKPDSLGDYDAMIAVEDQPIEELAGGAEVDGPDMGLGEANIFILAAHPQAAFKQAKTVLQRAQLLGSVSAAYRPIGSGAFTVIWPPLTREFTIA